MRLMDGGLGERCVARQREERFRGAAKGCAPHRARRLHPRRARRRSPVRPAVAFALAPLLLMPPWMPVELVAASPDIPTLVDDINDGPDGSYPFPVVDIGGTLFFQADNGVTGYELWKTDGTARGTNLVRDINPGSEPGFGPLSSQGNYFTEVTPASSSQLTTG